jgi:hypothetical protein
MEEGQGIVERVRSAISATFPAADIRDLELDPYYDRVTGVIIWPDFEASTQHERQQKLWDALESRLAEADLRRLSLLMTFSPAEYERVLAD